MLKETFTKLLKNYTDDNRLSSDLWMEIEQKHSEKKRYYHTLSHLDLLLKQLFEIKDKIENWDSVLFTLFYHDIVYNVLKSDNEEQSAELAVKRMLQVNVPKEIIAQCKAQILATKKHLLSSDSDTNYFTDADLSILGLDLDTYKTYFKNVRKEFSIYPDLIYNPGRKKVLKSFLEMDRIYKTDYFYHKLEVQAKDNLNYELKTL